MSSERRKIIGWTLYDWANSAFSTTVLAGVFPIFFCNYWCEGAKELSTFRLGVGHAVSALIVAFLAPLLGAIADRCGRRKTGLLVFAALGIAATVGLYFPVSGAWMAALTLLVVAKIGFACGNTFYDSMIVDVCPPEKRDFVSGLGYALGYLGGGLLFAVNAWMLAKPEAFGLADAVQAAKVCFLSVAVWWAVFSLPLAFWVPETHLEAGPGIIRESVKMLIRTLKDIRHDRTILVFLLAYFCYIDGVNTVIEMAVAYCQSIDIAIGRTDLIMALLMVQFIGFPAAIVFAWLGEKIGAKKGILIGIGVYAVVTGWSCMMTTKHEFYAMAAAIGLVQGAVQALSRSMFSRLIPPEKSAEYFGIYNILGKFAAILGPLVVAFATRYVAPRAGFLSLVPFFIIGAILLIRVPAKQLTVDN